MTRTLVALSVLVFSVASASALPVRLTTVERSDLEADLQGIVGDRLSVRTGGETRAIPLAEVVGLTLAAALTPDDAGGEKGEEDRLVAVELGGDDVLVGILLDGNRDVLRIRSRLLGPVELPLDAVRTIRFLAAGDRARLSRPPAEKDGITYRHGDTLSGWIDGFGKDALRIDCVIRDGYRVPYDRVAAVHLEAEAPAPPEDLVVRLSLADGGRLTARAPRLEGEELRVRPILEGLKASTTWRVPIAALRHLTVRNGAFAHLSDTTAWKVDVVPFFPPADPALDPSEWLAPKRDRSFLGTPLRLGGRTIHRGVGVVSGTTVRVDLGKAYRWFRATVGVDDAAGPQGSVTFEVLVDGKTKWRSPLIRHGAKPVAVPRVDLKGASVLELRVGYGDDAGADVQDFADWGEAILIR
jgi:hypothetical protein